ncbi:hypothetical protein A1O7_07887 [Cladophialophora yegresii CBS 114405]|uniref:Uncharacterized protein n=1 Tax=Cladophialophora yegresii CBS 114405 TaxID=1182544 RepID=W9WG91_9EURO|nr:uncharacterized protein A1O7_07887 [Cladophialophora yegresii CBS 114405]EXJ57539.1 hypothetical protein A1O7_07887 [Cladophialophora yegresii CBS 114405]
MRILVHGAGFVLVLRANRLWEANAACAIGEVGAPTIADIKEEADDIDAELALAETRAARRTPGGAAPVVACVPNEQPFASVMGSVVCLPGFSTRPEKVTSMMYFQHETKAVGLASVSLASLRRGLSLLILC